MQSIHSPIPLVNETEGLRIIYVLLCACNWELGCFSRPLDPPLPFDSSFHYLGRVEVGKSTNNVVVRSNCIAQGLIAMLPYYMSFISVLLHSLLLLCSVCASSFLFCSPQHVDLPLVTSNQCHDVTHIGRIHRDTLALPFEVVKHDGIEIDSFLKGCSALMLHIQILISLASVGPDKKLVCP